MSRQLIITDASSLINLEASQALIEIVEHRVYKLGIVDPYIWNETLYVRCPDPSGSTRVRIDLDAYERAGLAARVVLDQHELGRFVGFASRMDDGEAAGLAAAVARGLTMLVDDLAVRRVIAAEALTVEVVTTPMVLRAWASGKSTQLVSEVLRNVETFGKFIPPRSDPEYQWWMAARSP